MTTIVLGLDGASLDNIRMAMTHHELPNFAHLLDEGLSGDLASVYPYVTAPAWTSMFSGVNPGKHGIFDMFEIHDGVFIPANMRKSSIPFLWDYASWAGKRVLVLGPPSSFQLQK